MSKKIIFFLISIILTLILFFVIKASLVSNNLVFFKSLIGDEIKKILNLEKINVSERIRDLKYKDNKLYLFMENTSSIGVIDLT